MIFDLTYKLNPGERLVGIVRKHWFLIVPGMLEFAIIISLLIIFANKFSALGENFAITAFLIALFIVYLIYAWILLRINYFVITSERIIKIKQRGVWDRGMNEISISDISDITLNEKGIAATFLKFGSIKITLGNSAVFNMAHIADHLRIYQGLIKLKGIKKS
ncbi:MAG: hypothetical protein Q8N37_04330 [bacterium]|nr:hypothetical protein [bacterium]